MKEEMDFEELYNVYYMQVFSYIMTMIKNTHMTEEITQEVFFKALKKKDSYQGKSSELTWLCAIAKHTCMDHLRKGAKRADADLEEMESAENMEQVVEDQNMTLLIHQILHSMEEPYKEVFQLRIFGELSFEKIGQIFGKTETWARVTYHRARLKIQEKIERDEK